MRLAWPALAGGTLVLALGAAGLVRGAVPQAPASADTPGQLTVTGAYVRPPVAPSKNGAAYFTIVNTTDQPDELLSVVTGASENASVHTTDDDGVMTAVTNLRVPAHSRVVLTPGKAHVMLEDVIGTLSPGDRVTIGLQFRGAGQQDVTAPVVPFGQPAPTATSTGAK